MTQRAPRIRLAECNSTRPTSDRSAATGTPWRTLLTVPVLLGSLVLACADEAPAIDEETGNVPACTPTTAERSAQGFPFVDQLPSGACSTSDATCSLGVETRCCDGVSGAGYHTERCACTNGTWSCTTQGAAGSSVCTACADGGDGGATTLEVPANAQVDLLVRSRSFPPRPTACSGQEQRFTYDLTTRSLTSRKCIVQEDDAGADEPDASVTFEDSAKVLDVSADAKLRAALGAVSYPPRYDVNDCPSYLLTVTANGTSSRFHGNCEGGDGQAADNLWPLDDAFVAAATSN